MDAPEPATPDDPVARFRRADRARAWAEARLEWAQERIPGAEAALEAAEREGATGGGLLAGGLAYRLFFWLVSLGLVLAAGLSFWAEADPGGLEDAARRSGLAAVAAESAARAVEGEAHNRWYFLGAGLVLVVWFSRKAVRALVLAFALAWGERPPKLQRPTAAGMLFTVAVLATGTVGLALTYLRDTLGVAGVVSATLSLAFYTCVALWLMTLLPHGEAPWRALLPGAVLVSTGNAGLHVFTTLYLAPRLERSSELYGLLGAATVVLLWLYLAARLLTGSAFLNATLWERRHRRPETGGRAETRRSAK